ncbi:hypothetical protein E2C01_056320 [Portunus trituberculatus]|uniref:Uncharacterized protein n=1 Tax=Portunus trituberculatus TaxID=210409 RepID=A0A5B7GYU4_PORTR|nr:hypothetical protein [Portunus trituberculatus]
MVATTTTTTTAASSLLLFCLHFLLSLSYVPCFPRPRLLPFLLLPLVFVLLLLSCCCFCSHRVYKRLRAAGMGWHKARRSKAVAEEVQGAE